MNTFLKLWKGEKTNLVGFVIQFVLVCAPWTFHAGITWQLHGRLPCTNNLFYWLFVIYEYVQHCDKSSIVFQVSRFRVAFSCLAQVGQENPCLFRRCAMKWTYTLRLCLPRTSSASRSMSSVHLLLLGKIRTSDFVRNVITNLFLFFFLNVSVKLLEKTFFHTKLN